MFPGFISYRLGCSVPAKISIIFFCISKADPCHFVITSSLLVILLRDFRLDALLSKPIYEQIDSCLIIN